MDSLSEIINRLQEPTGDGTPPPSDPVPCPRCGGAGFLRYDVPYGDPNFGRLQTCACRVRDVAASRAARFRDLSHLGPLETKRFASFAPDKGLNAFSRDALGTALRIARDYATMPQGWL